tara:strand:- start:2564 stop:3535 length:972 start_codon:yes stop_codon:yes gene_type:complete
MNNLVLQKILHLHQLVETPKSDIDKELDTPNSRALAKLLQVPTYFSKNADGTTHVPNIQMKAMLKSFAQTISQAAKFYIDKRNTEFLTEKEYEAIESDLKIYAPYRSTFLQVEDDECVYNILCFDDGEVTQDTNEPILMMTMLAYIKEDDCFVLDINGYCFTFHEGSTYTFWLMDSPMSQFVDTGVDINNRYTNKALNTFVECLSSQWITLMILLQYPQIADAKDVKGRSNLWLDIKTKFTTSALRAKPNFEHKELKINMYGNAPTQSNNTNNNIRSIGTAFHSVRKHLRKLPNGKHTFVKAHFRGAKEHGVISKDYVINTNR